MDNKTIKSVLIELIAQVNTVLDDFGWFVLILKHWLEVI